jgi:plasmid stabilization system protein ParE
MKILWSDDAKQDYDKNIEYLLREWSEESAFTFIEEVESILELLKTNPKLYPMSDYKSI